MDLQQELALRFEIFSELAKQTDEKGGALTRDDLSDFRFGDRTIRILDQGRGIRNPQEFASTLSIMSKPDSPYADAAVGESLFGYGYTKGPIDGSDNIKLRRSAETRLPLILLRWINVDGIRYVPVFPVYVVADDPDQRRVIIALDERLKDVRDPLHLTEIERRYAQRLTKQRLHQPQFRSRVLMAYRGKCTVCRLARPQLLEAAHIIADRNEHGNADINNGLSLCKIHHSAYDQNLVGISPDFEVHVGPELMSARDEGPILRYGLKELDQSPLALPAKKRFHPSRDSLAERFAEFQKGARPARRRLDIGWPIGNGGDWLVARLPTSDPGAS